MKISPRGSQISDGMLHRVSTTAGSCWLLLLLCLGCLVWMPVSVSGRSVLGVDFGPLYMKVALVRSGSPLEIVTNMHSKRKTEQMVLFDQQQRFFGADANGLLQRKAHLTPATMSEFLGRAESHPLVQALVERHFPVTAAYNETRKGLTVSVPKAGVFTPEELVAMVLQHAVDFSVVYAKGAGSIIPPPQDIMLTVPSFYTQVERKALIDAARLANLNVLGLIDETTAAALHYATDKNFEEDQIFLFYNMGSSSLQVSIVRFFQYDHKSGFGKPKPTPALQVLAKAWDAKLGGLEWDHALVEHMADEFNKIWRQKSGNSKNDIRTEKRPMTKIRLAANKAKHVLSANNEYPLQLDALHEDISLRLTLTRSDLEDLTQHLLERAVQPALQALAAANMTVDNLTGVELLGGGMRVPSVQTKLASVLAPVELGLHMNADESMALGAAFVGANISTAFRVRQVGMTDIAPFAQQITLNNLGEPIVQVTETKKGEEEVLSNGWERKFQPYQEADETSEVWSKTATLFKSNSKVGVKKTIAFTHDEDVHCSLDYIESDLHVPNTEMALERYEISGVKDFCKELKEKGLEGKPKVSLQFELSASGITSLVKAEASMEETYTVEEEVEVEDDADDGNSTNATTDSDTTTTTTTTEDDKKTEKKETSDENETELNQTDASNATEKAPEEKKKKKFVKVEKEKKRIHKRSLKVNTYYEGKVQPHWESLLASSKAKLYAMAQADKQRIMLEEAKNKVESYMFMVKNKLVDDEEELATVSTEEQRETCRKVSADIELWLEDDSYGADLATLEDKFVELSEPFEKILLRLQEKTARPEMVEKVQKKLTQAEEILEKWTTSMSHITEEERQKVMDRIASVRGNLTAMEEAQATKEPHEEPAYLSSELVEKLKPLESLIQRLSKKPKPKPPKTTSDDANKTSSSSSSTNETTTDEKGNTTSSEDASADTPASDEDAAGKDSSADADKETDDEL
ncbi:hypothetical protein ACA910_004247 [Epithemia clementina (nom. ined.)]